MTARSFILGLTLGLAWPGLAAAASEEYRRIELQDGRVLLGAVEASSATGLEIRLPQGLTSVNYDQVLNLEELDAASWERQPPWTVLYIGPPESGDAASSRANAALTAALARLPATSLSRPVQLPRLSQEDRRAMEACRGEPACLQPFVDASGATVAISLRIESLTSTAVIASIHPSAPRARREISVSPEASAEAYEQAMLRGAQLALHLKPEAGARALSTTPPSDATPAAPAPPPPPVRTTAAPSPATLRAMAWLPVPGLPSLARRDWAGFGASWGVTVPGSLAMIAVAGQSSFRRPQLAVTGLGSFYLLTVTCNTAIGLRGLEAGVSAAPLPEGGMMLSLHAPLGGE